MPNPQIEQLIQSFAAQIHELARRAAVQQVLETLGSSLSARGGARRGAGRPTSAARTSSSGSGLVIKPVRKGKRRSAEDLERMGRTLLDHIRAHPGQRAEQIGAALRTDADTLRLPLQTLLGARKLKTVGQRRGTKYFIAGAAVPTAASKATRRKPRARGRKALKKRPMRK